MRLFNLKKNTEEEMILPELVLYWTGTMPLPPGAARVFPPNWNPHVNLITHSLRNKFKWSWPLSERAEDLLTLALAPLSRLREISEG